jgi:hypothetical protein
MAAERAQEFRHRSVPEREAVRLVKGEIDRAAGVSMRPTFGILSVHDVDSLNGRARHRPAFSRAQHRVVRTEALSENRSHPLKCAGFEHPEGFRAVFG